MKIRISITEPIRIDETIEGDSDDELFQKFRAGATSRAPLLLKMALKTMSDQSLRAQIIGAYNQKFKAQEPVPLSASEFIAFGERAGFVTRL